MFVLQKYYENRLNYIGTLDNPYPHESSVSRTISEYVKEYEGLLKDQRGVHLEDITESLAGMVMKQRSSGPGCFFYDLCGNGARVQIYASARYFTFEYDDWFNAVLQLLTCCSSTM